MDKKAVLALGGNAILQAGQKGTITEQFANTRGSLGGVVELIRQGYKLAITHGNGPQVGNLMIQQKAGMDHKIEPLPLGVLNAATEGTMGYMIEQSLQNLLGKQAIDRQVVTILSQVLIDMNDPSIKNPTKPVGPFYTREQADRLAQENGWVMVEDAGRGYRQVVPSPYPTDIVQKALLSRLVEEGFIVIACGGGGIPVYFDSEGKLEGYDAVIDKDFASALLAEQIGASRLVILTGVDRVAIHFGKPDQQDIAVMTAAEAKAYYEAGEFPKGSMGPKILASIRFLDGHPEREVLITSIERICEAFEGKTGTIIKG